MPIDPSPCRIRALSEQFDRVVGLDPGPRDAALAALEQEDPVLAQRLRGLLEADARMGPEDRLPSWPRALRHRQAWLD